MGEKMKDKKIIVIFLIIAILTFTSISIYKNLFRKNRGDFLYIIRAEAGKNSSHKKDNSNNWGRANALSIVSAVNLGEIYQKVKNMIILENKKELSV